jgi:hypothetical protein
MRSFHSLSLRYIVSRLRRQYQKLQIKVKITNIGKDLEHFATNRTARESDFLSSKTICRKSWSGGFGDENLYFSLCGFVFVRG